MEIRVNSLADKKAIKSFQRALKCLGVSIDDLCSIKDLVEQNRKLMIENEKLRKDPILEAKRNDAKNLFREAMQGPETIRQTKKEQESNSYIRNVEALK